MSKNQSESSSLESRKSSSGNRTEEQFKRLKAELQQKHKQGLHPEKRLFNEVKSHKYYDKEYEDTDSDGNNINKVEPIKIDELRYKDIKDNKIEDNGIEYAVYNGQGYISEEEWLDDKKNLESIILAYNKVNEKGGVLYTIQNYTGSFWERVRNEFLHPTTD